MLNQNQENKNLIAIDATRSNTHGSKRFIKTILNGLITFTSLKVIVYARCENFDSFNNDRVHVKKIKTKQGGILTIIYATLLIPLLAWRDKAKILYSPWDIGPLIRPIPFILGIHSPNCLTPKKYKSQTMPWLHECLTKISASKAIGIEMPSYSAAKDIGNHMGIDSKKIKVIYHGAELSKWNKVITSVERSTNNPYIIFWSWFYRAKNFETLLRGYKKYISKYNHNGRHTKKDEDYKEDEKLYCVGKFVSDDYKREINELIQELDLTSKVRFFEHPDDEELVELLYNSKALVIPSLYETFGFMYVEGRLFNKPFFVADNEVAREVTEGQCIYFKGLDSDDLAEKMYDNLQGEDCKNIDWQKKYVISEIFFEEYAEKELAKYFNGFFNYDEYR
jgi:glycosyltransferase involved in cell wall biosynthesis